jgi:DNA-binding CsgD family transcriptional regulator/N-acetylneuraminic acid mutarotase
MPELGEPLSDRELEVLRCLSRGAGNKEIAAELFISENTVKVHLRNIFTKLGVASRTEATAVALQQGVIVMPGVELPGSGNATAVATFPPPVTPDTTSTPTDDAPADSTTPPITNSRRYPLMLMAVSLTAVALLMLVVLVRQFNPTASATPPPYESVDLGENWATIRPLPAPRSGLAAQAIGLRVYAIGGKTAEGVTDSVLAYEAQSGGWTEVARKPTAVTEASAASLFGEIFVPGGRLADGQPTDILEVYSPTNDAWRIAQSLPQPIAGGLTLSDGSFLYLFGGWDGEKYLDTAYAYDPVQDRWQPLPPMSHARAHLAGASLIGNLYAVGGFDGENILAVCEQFNPQTETWQSCPDMLQPRARAGAATILNKLYVVGGEQTAGETAPFSELFDPVGQQWTILNTPVLANATTWAKLGAAHVETTLYMLGGEQDGRMVADSYQYSPLIYQTFIPAASSGSGE